MMRTASSWTVWAPISEGSTTSRRTETVEKDTRRAFLRALEQGGMVGDGYYILDNKDPMIPVFDTAGSLLHEADPTRHRSP